MLYRQFGATDLSVSVICFGPMRFVARQAGDDQQSQTGKRALSRALERGVNFIHSSYEYGTRWALGQVLKDHPRRSELHHIIKLPVPDSSDNGRFDSAKFRLRVEEALRDLHAERIAVLQYMQRADPNTDQLRIPQIKAVREAMLATFLRLKAEGKVGYLTTFPYTPGFAAAALATGDYSGMVAYFNPIEMEMIQFFESMQERGMGFLCIRPFMGGLLTDRRIERRRLPGDDRMQAQEWDKPYERLELLKGTIGTGIDSWTAFAIRFALIHPIVTSLIVGLNTPQQVDEVLDAAEGPFPSRVVFDQALRVFETHGMMISH